MVAALAWSGEDQLIVAADKKEIEVWSTRDDIKECKVVAQLDSYPIDMAACADHGRQMHTKMAAIGCADGQLVFMAPNGRILHSVKAHDAAVTSVSWNNEGTALLTAGEDGFIKQWSQSGNLRSKLLHVDTPINCVRWSPDEQSVLYCTANFIAIKPLRVAEKQVKWTAHQGTVLQLDWCAANNLIVSGGEDCRYKVWDHFGRQLFSSGVSEYSVSSVAWNTNGSLFAVGSFNTLAICDAAGWTHARMSTETGSVTSLKWRSDGTHVAIGGGNGATCIGHVIDKKTSWRNFEAVLTDSSQVTVYDILRDDHPIVDELEFGEPVIEISMNYGHLIVATLRKCYIYNLNSLISPAICDIKGDVTLIVQSLHSFILVDTVKGIQVFTYEGRVVSNPRLPGLTSHAIHESTISLSIDSLAIIDAAKNTQIVLLDPENSKPLSNPIVHEAAVIRVSLSPVGMSNERMCVFVDSNCDLWLTQTHSTLPASKIASMVDSFRWHEDANILVALSDGKIVTWYLPEAVFMDQDLLHKTRVSKELLGVGRHASILSVSNTKVLLRASDGVIHCTLLSPFPQKLRSFCISGNWSNAIRLCRFAKDTMLWACLAAMAINSHELEAAEIAFSEVDEVDKLEFVQHIMSLPSEASRNAEIALYLNRPQDAESILLRANLVYRAIMLHVCQFNWKRALDLAVKSQQHIDTVLGYRQDYLRDLGVQENDGTYLHYMKQVEVNWEQIRVNEQAEEDNERAQGQPFRRTLTKSMKHNLQQATQQQPSTSYNGQARTQSPQSHAPVDPPASNYVPTETSSPRLDAVDTKQEYFPVNVDEDGDQYQAPQQSQQQQQLDENFNQFGDPIDDPDAGEFGGLLPDDDEHGGQLPPDMLAL
jgi:intraflagellar transport protein 80